MFHEFWVKYLFQPLYNLLIYLYWNDFSYFNLGIAVIYLTIILRVILLPLSIISERSKAFYDDLSRKIKEIYTDFANDPVKAKNEVRKLLRKNQIRPWAKVIVLGVQLLVLIVLYQVFLGGIGGVDKYHLLYPFVTEPEFINVNFLIFDISKHSVILSGLVGVVLFLEIAVSQASRSEFLTRRDVLYRFFFPLFVFALLVILPAVKALFILTSILFSIIIILARNLFGALYRRISKK